MLYSFYEHIWYDDSNDLIHIARYYEVNEVLFYVHLHIDITEYDMSSQTY